MHALAYPLGGHFHIPHGLSNSLVLPHVLRFNAEPAATQYAELFDIIAPTYNLNNTDLSDNRSKTRALITYFEQLIRTLGLPNRLRDAGVTEDSLSTLASDAMLQQRLLINNPREVTEADALSIYQTAF